MTDGHGLTRRAVVGTWCAGVGVVLAGCVDGEDPGENDSGLQAGTPDGDFVEHGGSEPESVPADYRCDGLCGMVVADWPGWNAQIAHETGEAVFFCSPGDMILYAQDPAGHGGPDSPIAAAWVSEFDSGTLIDALAAHYVLDYDEDRYDEPMNNNPRPFADEDDAVAFTEQYDDLSADDIIGFEAFDRELAAPYSGHRIPPWEH